MKKTLLLIAALAGCGQTEPTELAQPLLVWPIAGLPAYEGGRILHPYHFSKPEVDRFPSKPIDVPAADVSCLWGDDFFDRCRVYDCEATKRCPVGTCWDVSLMHDPDGSPEPIMDWHHIPVVYHPSGVYYQPLHQATCLLIDPPKP